MTSKLLRFMHLLEDLALVAWALTWWLLVANTSLRHFVYMVAVGTIWSCLRQGSKSLESRDE